jgi:hypothetical protein
MKRELAQQLLQSLVTGIGFALGMSLVNLVAGLFR